MKRDHYLPTHHPFLYTTPAPPTSGSSSSFCAANSNPKPHLLWNNAVRDPGMDELLAVLGYKVKSTDMADVANKIEQLEQFMFFKHDDGLSHLASETVHYNPSDLSSWLESMITELDPIPNFDSFINESYITSTDSTAVTVLDPRFTIFDDSSSDYDLKLIPGNAVYPQIQQLPPPPPPQQFAIPNKRLKTSPASASASASSSSSSTLPGGNWGIVQNEPICPIESSPRPVVVVDLQENGIRLVHSLMACAEAVHKGDVKIAEALVKQIGCLAVSQPGAMRKVATYFAEALARRIYRLYPTNVENAFSDFLEMHFYETCPYLKFAHFTANQAILEAFTDKKRVHVIDFSMKEGMQWPALMQALALRPGGPPSFRLTGIGPPSNDNTDHLQEVGWKLAQLAETIHVEFEYRGFVANSLADLDAKMINLREGEVVAVNSVFELHQLLGRANGIEKVLSAVKEMKPEIVTVVEQEAKHNGGDFLERFKESLHYYSTLFDSLESCEGAMVSNEDRMMSEVYLGKQICNVVACEGTERLERHETMEQWKVRLEESGLESVHLGSNAFKQASMLLALFAGGDGYKVEEKDGCLMLAWHTRPLITTSAWKLGSAPTQLTR